MTASPNVTTVHQAPAQSAGSFVYDDAFSRNLGWLTDWEQQALREKRVAIAGLGGVGGVHLMTLARLGIGKFTLADFDSFDQANFNRQMGASMSTVGLPKVGVLTSMALDVNPELDLRCFAEGVTEDNMDAFLEGADVFVDGLDFFVLDVREAIFRRCRELGIPAVTAAPIGMGTSYLTFTPDGMSFEKYFGFAGRDHTQRYVNFLLGLTPTMMHASYIRDRSRVDFDNQRGPSTPMACQMCAGVAGVEAVKLMLGRGKVRPAPWVHHFDPYLGRYISQRLWRGYRNPAQTIKRFFAYRLFDRLAAQSRPAEDTSAPEAAPIDRIVDLARWTPSGDNVQHWQFEVVSPEWLRVHTELKPGENVYEYKDCEPIILALGMLIETVRLAATLEGLASNARVERQGNTIVVDITFKADAAVKPDPLAYYIRVRSVDRRPYRSAPVNDAQYRALELALGGKLTVDWYDAPSERWRLAKLNARATAIRLSIKECYQVHRDIIDTQARFSRTGVPLAAVGVDPLAQRILAWSLKSWWRTKLVNSVLKGTLLARAQLDLLPGWRCASHFCIRWRDPAKRNPTLDERLQAGAAIQRFWLTAARFGLALQPSLATLIFAHYGQTEEPFTASRAMLRRAAKVHTELDALLPDDAGTPVFLGRLGWPVVRTTPSRSIRKQRSGLERAGGGGAPEAPKGEPSP